MKHLLDPDSGIAACGKEKYPTTRDTREVRNSDGDCCDCLNSEVMNNARYMLQVFGTSYVHPKMKVTVLVEEIQKLNVDSISFVEVVGVIRRVYSNFLL